MPAFMRATTSGALPASAGYLALAAFGAVWGLAISFTELDALFLAAAMTAAAFILYDYRIGVVLLTVLMPLSRSTLFPHQMLGVTGLNPFNLLLLATLAACLLRPGAARLAGFVPGKLLWLYVVPIIVAGMIGARHVGDIAPLLLAAEDPLSFDSPVGYIRDLVVKPLMMVLYALLLAAAIRDSREPQRFLAPVLVSVCVMSLLLLLFFVLTGASIYTLAGTYTRSFLEPLGLHANDLGRLYAVAFALLLFTWARARDPQFRLWLFATMGLSVVALLLTFSRGAFIGLVVVSLLFLATRRSFKMLLLGLGAIAVSMPLLPGAFYYRVTMGLASGDLDFISAGRIDEIWLPLMANIASVPPWGNGLSSILWAEPMRAGLMLPVTHPHNAFLGAYLDLGAIGLVLVLAYFWLIARELWRLQRDPALSPEMAGFFEGAAVGLVAFLIVGMAGSSLTPVVEQYYLWVAIGFLYGFRRRQGNAPAPATRTRVAGAA
jgi:hypothetical protein